MTSEDPKPCCAACPCDPCAACLATRDPRFAHFCALASSGDPLQRSHVVGRSALGLDPVAAAPTPPSLAARARSLAAALVEHATSGGQAPPDVATARLALCRANLCGMYSDDPDGPACLACGCWARGLKLKASWAEQSCPLDPPIWGPVDPV